MEEKKEREFASGVDIEVTNVKFKMDRDGDHVAKVIFETGAGNVTFKPKVLTTERIRGIAVEKIQPCTFDEVCERVFEISKEANEKGVAKVLATYHIWNTVQDGSPATYRYVHGNAQMNEWSIIKEPIVQEQVVR